MTIEVIHASNVAADDPTMLELKSHISVSESDKTVTFKSTPCDPVPVGTFNSLLAVRFIAFELTQDIPLRVTAAPLTNQGSADCGSLP